MPLKQVFTNREQLIIAMVCDAYCAEAISEQTQMSTETVKRHLNNVFNKLGRFGNGAERGSTTWLLSTFLTRPDLFGLDRTPYRVICRLNLKKPRKYPYENLINIGDSFYVPFGVNRKNLASAVAHYAKRQGIKVSVRRGVESYRIERTA